MRILDLVRLHQDGVTRILDEAPGSVDIRRYVLLPDDVRYERAGADPSTPVDAGTLALTIAGPDPGKHASEEAVAALANRLEPGARAIVFFAWPPEDLPYHRYLDALTASGTQVVHAAAIDTETLRSAAVIQRVDDVVPPRGPLGDAVIGAPSTDAGAMALRLRLANEYAFLDLSSRHLRAATRQDSPVTKARDANLAFRSKLADEVKQRDARIAQLKAQVARVEGSTSYKLGRMLIRAARSPKSLLLLPRDMFRLWRDRGRA